MLEVAPGDAGAELAAREHHRCMHRVLGCLRSAEPEVFVGVLERGMPIAQCVAVPRDALMLEFGELVGDAAQAFRHTLDAVNVAPGAYRRHFRVPKPGRE